MQIDPYQEGLGGDWLNILGLDDAEHYKQDSALFQVYYTVNAKRFDK